MDEVDDEPDDEDEAREHEQLALHLRKVALPDVGMLTEAIGRIASFLESKRS